MGAVITAEGLTKFYGKTLGIEDVDLEVRRGEIFGFLGPNGAGKSTTIRLLLDFIRPTRGRCAVLGLDSKARSVDIHRRVGYVPGDLSMYEKMTARELLTYFASLRALEGLGVAEAVAERLRLDLDQRIRSYSSGNRQKVGLVQAFMHEPELLVLDEPTNGLDPLVQQEFYRLVFEAKAQGRTVFLSSHILPEVERIADRVGIIRSGRLVVVEQVAALKAKAVRKLEMRFAAAVPVDEFSRLPSVLEARSEDGGAVVTVTVEGSVDPVIKAAAGHEVVNLVTHEGDLEEAFLAYYESEEDADAP
jgi:ABC-2 type transport system ATP-binding protein